MACFPGGTQARGRLLSASPGGDCGGGLWSSGRSLEPVPGKCHGPAFGASPSGAHVRWLPSAQGSLYFRPACPTAPCPSPQGTPSLTAWLTSPLYQPNPTRY